MMSDMTGVPPCPGGQPYTIRPGDTLSAIAMRFGVTLDELIRANQGIDPDWLAVARRICIPVPAAPGRCPIGSRPYIIRSGDTFYSIAQRLGTTVDELRRLNPDVDPDALAIGQRICVPMGAPGLAPSPKCPGELYTIKSGDTFYSIARRYGVRLEALLRANPGVDPDNLQVGQQICIPRRPGPGVPWCPGGTIHTVAQGETLYTISQKYSVPLNALIAANPQISDPNVISVGMKVCIPRQ